MKSTQLLPNAIRLRTKNRDEYLFAGYIPRERIFVAIDRLRQNALQDRVSDRLEIHLEFIACFSSHSMFNNYEILFMLI